jgi:hypothetical protein
MLFMPKLSGPEVWENRAMTAALAAALDGDSPCCPEPGPRPAPPVLPLSLPIPPLPPATPRFMLGVPPRAAGPAAWLGLLGGGAAKELAPALAEALPPTVGYRWLRPSWLRP